MVCISNLLAIFKPKTQGNFLASERKHLNNRIYIINYNRIYYVDPARQINKSLSVYSYNGLVVRLLGDLAIFTRDCITSRSFN